MRVTSTPDCASSCAAAAASLALSEPERSDPGITRIFSADIFQKSHFLIALGTSPPRLRRAASTLAIHPDPGGRKVHPDPLGGFCEHARQRFRDRRGDRIGELHEGGGPAQGHEGGA